MAHSATRERAEAELPLQTELPPELQVPVTMKLGVPAAILKLFGQFQLLRSAVRLLPEAVRKWAV